VGNKKMLPTNLHSVMVDKAIKTFCPSWQQTATGKTTTQLKQEIIRRVFLHHDRLSAIL
jgi:hypothetical protein